MWRLVAGRSPFATWPTSPCGRARRSRGTRPARPSPTIPSLNGLAHAALSTPWTLYSDALYMSLCISENSAMCKCVLNCCGLSRSPCRRLWQPPTLAIGSADEQVRAQAAQQLLDTMPRACPRCWEPWRATIPPPRRWRARPCSAGAEIRRIARRRFSRRSPGGRVPQTQDPNPAPDLRSAGVPGRPTRPALASWAAP